MKQKYLSYLKGCMAALVAVAMSAQAQDFTFRNGVNGYTGASDTQVHSGTGGQQTTDYSALNPLNIDTADGGGAVQVLLRFDNIIGAGPNQIPAGSTIANATLVLRSTANNANGNLCNVHRMLEDWTHTCTASSCFNGNGQILVQADDIEANITADGQINPNFTNPADNPLNTRERTLDVTATVQAWVNGAVPNYGWVIMNTGGDGYRIDTSETTIVTNRPGLLVYLNIDPPTCIDQPDNTTVVQCRTATFGTAWEGVPPIQYQWLYEVVPGDFQPVDSVANPSALTPTLVISNVQPSHAGNYKVQAVNQGGSTDSQVATLTVTPDGDGPVAIKAVVSADRTQITISYNEPVLASDGLGNDNAQDPFDYSIHEVGNPGNFLSVQQSPLPPLVNRTNIVLVIDPGGPQWVDGTMYEIDIVADIPDECTGVRSLGETVPVIQPLTIRENLNGYVGTLDTELNRATPDNANGTDVSITVDGDAGGGNPTHALLRFSNIFGSNPGQIAVGASINVATLTLQQTDGGALMNAHRMLVTWDESSTWNSLTDGVTVNGVDAISPPEFTIPNAGNGPRTFNVTAAVQAWATNPQSNHGWAFIPTGTDGWDFATKENVTEASRPTLTVEFTVPETPVGIPQQPPASITINEGQTLNISCVVTGFNPQIQWFRNNAAIPGATQQNYNKANANPNDNGNYHLTADNDFGPPVTSSTCVVSVIPDTTAPTVVRTVADPDMTTIRLTYSEIMGASAGSAGNYSIAGLTINSVTLQPDGSNVVITTSARTFRQSYNLTITGVRDDAIAGGGNLLNPNPTVVSISSDIQRLIGFHDMWFWNTNCQDFTGWETTAFDPAANGWLEGPGSFGLETGGMITTLANLGAQIQTPWAAPSANFLAAYLRKAVTIPAGLNLSGAQIVIRYLRDDGMLLYVDGAETIRTSNMTNDPTSCLNVALNAFGEGDLETNVLAMAAGQTYQVAVQLQQNAATSSDVLFAAEFYAVLPATTLTITQDPIANTVTVSWTPAVGQLEESTNLSAPNQGFGNSARQNGVAFANPGTTTFYRVRR